MTSPENNKMKIGENYSHWTLCDIFTVSRSILFIIYDIFLYFIEITNEVWLVDLITFRRERFNV